MKTHEQIISDWEQTTGDYQFGEWVPYTHKNILDLCRRVAEEQKERDARIAEEHAKKPKWWKQSKKSDGVKRNQVAREFWATKIAAAIRQQEQHDEQ